MIHVENLTKYYNDFCAVDHINLNIEKGEILGLLGPNGAGKTTTLRMLTGFFMPTSGNIHIKDYSINENLLEIKRLIGYLPESAPLYYNMIVYDYLDYVAKIRGLSKDNKNTRIQNMVSLCGLNNIMHKNIGQLSKGLNQRVGLAHAMMSNPEILVLDEPTSGLDPNQIVEIRKIIREIGKEKTVIISTHILTEAEATCDRIVIINKGKIIADDSTQKLKESAGLKKFIHISLTNAKPQEVQESFKKIEGIIEIEQINTAKDRFLHFRLTCKSQIDLREKIYQTIKNSDWILIEFHQETKTLETIFRELTARN